MPGVSLLAILAIAAARLAAAQPPQPERVRVLVQEFDPRGVLQTSRPRPAPPALTAAGADSLHRAQTLRRQGALDAARVLFEGLLRRYPHHPGIVAELVETHYATHAWGPLERLCRGERQYLRDSLFLAQPLVQALTYQGRHREAAQAAVEAVIASPEAAGWAAGELRNLALADPAGVGLARDGLRVAWTKDASREDLLRLLAQQEYLAGNLDRAVTLLETPLKLRGGSAHLLMAFGDEQLQQRTTRDSSAAARAYVALARNPAAPEPQRLVAARRALGVRRARGQAADAAHELARGLADVPPARWGTSLALDLARALREAGRTAESRELLERLTADAAQAPPDLVLERALGDLRDGRAREALEVLGALAAGDAALEAARFHYGEALFFSGSHDSARAVLEALARDRPASEHAGAALERVYLIEEGRPREALQAMGRAFYLRWRKELRAAEAAADSLFRGLPRGPLWAHAGLLLAEVRENLGEYPEALGPLLAVADSLPADRLAPLARKRRGDIYRARLKDDARALEEYEECLARYPKAWLAPEVRRVVETMRRSRTF